MPLEFGSKEQANQLPLSSRDAYVQSEQQALRTVTPLKLDVGHLVAKCGSRYDTTFDPFKPDYIKGYESYAQLFVKAKNKDCGDAIKAHIDEQITYHSSVEYRDKVAHDTEIMQQFAVGIGAVIAVLLVFLAARKLLTARKATQKAKDESMRNFV